MNRYLIGAVAGIIATAVMTLAMSLGKLAGFMSTPPPEQVTAKVADLAGIDAHPPEHEFTTSSLITHHGFGAVAGAVYVAIRRFLPSSSPVTGLIFGGLVWITAYAGYLPALKLYPWPEDDRASRTAVMIVAHAVFGTTLVETEKRLAERM